MAITATDIAWAAGFIEGEGTFTSNALNAQVTVAAVQVQYEPLGKLLALLGGRVKPYVNNHGRLHYKWSVNGTEAIGVTFTLFPFLSRKRRDQAQRMVGIWKIRPGRDNRWKTHCPRGHEYTADNTRRYGGKQHRHCAICVRTVYPANRRLALQGEK